MKRILFIIFICSILTLTSSCNFLGKNISTDRVKISYTESDLSNENMDITLQIPIFKNIKNGEFAGLLNERFFNDIQNHANEFTKTAGEFAKNLPEGRKPSLSITCYDEYNDNDFLSMITVIETYTGGVHSTIRDISTNIDLQTNRIVTLADLFKEDCDYKKILTKILSDLAAENSELYGELWEKPIVTDDTDNSFYIKDGNLIIFYQPYEIASYGRGFVDFTIPLSSLKTYLNEDFYRFTE